MKCTGSTRAQSKRAAAEAFALSELAAFSVMRTTKQIAAPGIAPSTVALAIKRLRETGKIFTAGRRHGLTSRTYL